MVTVSAAFSGRAAEAHRLCGKEGLRIALSERFEHLHFFYKSGAKFAERRIDVDVQGGGERGGRILLCVFFDGVCEAFDFFRFDFQSCGHFMSAEPGEMVRAGGDGGEDVETGDGACGALREFFIFFRRFAFGGFGAVREACDGRAINKDSGLVEFIDDA